MLIKKMAELDDLDVPSFHKGFPSSPACKESICNTGDSSSIPALGRSTAEGNGYPLQHSGLENSMDIIVHGVTKSWTRLSDFHFLSSHKHTNNNTCTKSLLRN